MRRIAARSVAGEWNMADVEVVTEEGTGLLTAPSWDAFAAAQGTVFHTARFLLSWWRDRSAENPPSRLLAAEVVDDEGVLGTCAFELASGVLSFAGGRDVVDYMGPLALPGREKEVAAALAEWVFDGPPWVRADFAGLVHNDAMAQAFADEVTRSTPAARVGIYDQAPRIEAVPNGYLPLLNAKRRADVLRKRNRLIEAVGELELVISSPDTVVRSLERLLAWKADTGPATRDFVAEYGGFLRTMVARLAAADAGHVVDLRASGRPLAAAIMLRHRDTDYIYNMAYDPAFPTGARAGLAPGVVLVSLLVERSLGQGSRFDFLKGAQDYKLRLGGVPVDLIDITVER
jgi:CelD/BcsL family acetyltransferase involved in cellulose biosynthesis